MSSNYLSIKRIYAIEPGVGEIPRLLATVSEMMEDPNLGFEWGGIYNNNWGDDFPYAPKARFRAAHNGNAIIIKFMVEEQFIKAETENDGGKVSQDSCVEFFVSFDQTGYYTFEFSCIGKKHVTFRKNRESKTTLPAELFERIMCVSSLGTENFAERQGNFNWELIVAIPKEVFFMHDFDTLEGLFIKANAYKCGDGLSKPHFLSWNPINTEKPDFHRPEFFGRMRLL